MHAHVCTNTTAGPTARVGESSVPIFTTGAVGRRLQHPLWRRRDLIMETHGISILIPLEADISRGRLHHQVNSLHHYGVEGTTACQGSSWIHRIRCHSSNTSSIIPRPDEEGHGRVSYRIDQGELMIKASTKDLSFPIYYKSWSSYSSVIWLFSYKSNNNKFQVFIKPATV